MNTVKYDRHITALLVIDPYNDFISEGGKVWDRLREVAEANNCIPRAIAVLNAARNAQVRQRTRRVDGFARRGDCAVARRRIVTTSSTAVRMPTTCVPSPTSQATT
jgi:hypothetical protein